jgi:flagellar motor switch protein FliM
VSGKSAIAQPVSLVGASPESGAFPAMERIGQLFARGLRDYLASSYACEPMVGSAAGQVKGYADWQGKQPISAFITIRLQNKLPMLVALPLPTLLGMVDLFYGGMGAEGEAREELTSAELRFADRLGERMAALLASAWSGVQAMQPARGAFATSTNAKPLCGANELIFVQRFAISDMPIRASEISCAYPLAALRPLLNAAGEEGAATTAQIDGAWSARINAAALNIRLPVRTIFARPEISVSQLLALKPGDIIPLLLPQNVPVTVAGRQFAQGTVGEANGRAAIRIEKMKEGFFHE